METNRGKGLRDKDRMENTPHSGRLGKENQMPEEHSGSREQPCTVTPKGDTAFYSTLSTGTMLSGAKCSAS